MIHPRLVEGPLLWALLPVLESWRSQRGREILPAWSHQNQRFIIRNLRKKRNLFGVFASELLEESIRTLAAGDDSSTANNYIATSVPAEIGLTEPIEACSGHK